MIVNQFNMNRIMDISQVQNLHDLLVENFPDEQVITIPDGYSIMELREYDDLETLENIYNLIGSAIKELKDKLDN